VFKIERRPLRAGDPIPTPYSVQPDLERFLRQNAPKDD
jgi:hypothetical protein